MALLTVISATSAQPPNVRAQCVSWQKDFCYSRSSFSCLAIIYSAAVLVAQIAAHFCCHFAANVAAAITDNVVGVVGVVVAGDEVAAEHH